MPTSFLRPDLAVFRTPSVQQWGQPAWGPALQPLKLRGYASRLASEIAIRGWEAFTANTTKGMENRAYLNGFQKLVGLPLSFQVRNMQLLNPNPNSGVLMAETAGALIYFVPSMEPVLRKMWNSGSGYVWNGQTWVKGTFATPWDAARVQTGKNMAAAAEKAGR